VGREEDRSGKENRRNLRSCAERENWTVWLLPGAKALIRAKPVSVWMGLPSLPKNIIGKREGRMG
jgi:hypothetical protein